MKPLIQAVVADDSPSVRRLLCSYLRPENGFRVVAAVADGDSAVAAVERHRPHVVTLDVDMPGSDGLSALRRIMGRCPTPTVMISGVGSRGAALTLQALADGAVDFVLKFSPGAPCDADAMRRDILQKIRNAAGIRTVRTLGHAAVLSTAGAVGATPPEAASSVAPPTPWSLDGGAHGSPSLSVLLAGVVVVGASTGGPVALRQLLSRLPAGFPQPIIVVQHIPATFIQVLASQLSRHTPLEVHAAEDGEILRPGKVLIAPGDVHLMVRSDGRVHHHRGPAVGGHCPAIDITMQTAARTFGHRARGVLLTGMGNDGVEGMRAIRIAGGHTLAQDESSSVIWGMPRLAKEEGTVDFLAPPQEIAQQLACLARSIQPSTGAPQPQGMQA